MIYKMNYKLCSLIVYGNTTARSSLNDISELTIYAILLSRKVKKRIYM